MEGSSGRRGTVTEKKIVRRFAEIAFDPETKDSDRLRALDWLAEHLHEKNGQEEILHRLDRVLAELKKDPKA